MAGRWVAPYTEAVVTNPKELDVDHLVPLANAHRSAGHAWDRSRERVYANNLEEPGHLVAITTGANRAKGAKGPEDWRSPDLLVPVREGLGQSAVVLVGDALNAHFLSSDGIYNHYATILPGAVVPTGASVPRCCLRERERWELLKRDLPQRNCPPRRC